MSTATNQATDERSSSRCCRAPTRGQIIVALAVVLLAFALRVYRLDTQCLRGDEALTHVYSTRSLAEMSEILKATSHHPPVFYSLMHEWLSIAGESEYSLRYVPVVAGVLLVVAVMVLGRMLIDGWSGIVASTLVAINPFEVYYSQDARSYTLVTLIGVLSTLCLWRALRRRSWRHWAIYGMLTVALAYTHYYFFLIVAFQALFVAWDAWRRRRIPWQYGLTGIVAALMYLPWFLYGWGLVASYEGAGESVDLLASLGRPLLAFAGGLLLSPPISWVNGAAIWPLLGLGLVGLWRLKRGALLLVASYLLVPLLLVFFVSRFRPIFNERYLILASPAFFLLVGVGLTQSLRRPPRWVAAGSAVVATVFLATGAMALANYYFNPSFAKSPPWRDVLDYIRRKDQPGDVLVYTAPLPEILYYNERAVSLPTSLIPYEQHSPVTDVVKALQDTLAEHPHVWLIPLPASEKQVASSVEPWLDRHSVRLDQVFFRVIHMGLYQSPAEFARTMTSQSADLAEVAGATSGVIRLEGFRLGNNGDVPFTIAPGQPIPLTLMWRATDRPKGSYTVFTHVVGPDGALWGQWDNPPVWGTYPTGDWSAGEVVFDQYRIPLREDTPPGAYRLLVGMYEPGSGARLPVVDSGGQPVGDSVQLIQPIVVQSRGQ